MYKAGMALGLPGNFCGNEKRIKARNNAHGKNLLYHSHQGNKMGLKYLVKYFFDHLAFIYDYVSFAPASHPVSVHVVTCSSWD